MSKARINVIINNQPLYEKIAQLQQEIVTLEQTITNLNAQITDLNQQIEQKQATIDSLNTQISQLQEQISQLDAQVTALTEQVHSLILENDDLLRQVATLGQRVNELAEEINDLNSQIASMNQQISDINGEESYLPSLDYLAETKQELMTALIGKGANINENTRFRNYAYQVQILNVLPSGSAADTICLFHFDKDTQLTDSGHYGYRLAAFYQNNPQFVTDVGKFGNGSLYLDGATALYVTTNQFNPFAYPEWTFELWFNQASTSQQWKTFLSCYKSYKVDGSSNYQYQYFRINYYDGLNFDYPSDVSGSMVAIKTSNVYPSANTWHHLALCKNSTDPSYLCRYYYDGVFKSWYSGSSSNWNMNFRNFYSLPALNTRMVFFGQYNGSTNGNYFQGYVNELRISKVCRYKENFTPPTEPFTV